MRQRGRRSSLAVRRAPPRAILRAARCKFSDVQRAPAAGPIFAALDALLPKLAAAGVAVHDADAMHNALRSISLAGVLPPPPPIAVRRYQSNEFSHAWLSQVLWGLIYSRNQRLFDARRVRLVQILQVQ